MYRLPLKPEIPEQSFLELSVVLGSCWEPLQGLLQHVDTQGPSTREAFLCTLQVYGNLSSVFFEPSEIQQAP